MAQDCTIDIDSIAQEIASVCNGEYDNGPCDGAEACNTAIEFADYWLDGAAGDDVVRIANAYGLNERELWRATSAELRRIYDAERHGPEAA
jgi:hypothetical protein